MLHSDGVLSNHKPNHLVTKTQENFINNTNETRSIHYEDTEVHITQEGG